MWSGSAPHCLEMPMYRLVSDSSGSSRRMRAGVAIGLALALVMAGRGPTTVTAAQQKPGAQALRIVVLEGDSGVNIIDQKTAVAPVVEVRDRNDAPVVGAQVTFLIRTGAGRATLNSGLRQVTLVTNTAGRATVAVNPLSSG